MSVVNIVDKALSFINWLTGKADQKKLDKERHLPSRIADAHEAAQDREKNDTSKLERILGE